MVVATKFCVGSRLHKEKVLASLTLVVLNGNLIVKLVIECYIMLFVFFELLKV